MKSKNKKEKFPSELRCDLVSKDWVIIATGRAKRPDAFKEKKRVKVKKNKKDCPFCKIETQGEPKLVYFKGKKVKLNNGKVPKNWTTMVIPNKYPALVPQSTLRVKKEGKFYQRMNAVGFCELVITKDHEKHFPQFTIKETKEIFDAYKERYLELAKESFVNHISIFYNHGLEAGASQPHPHSQIITTPLIDVDLSGALSNAKKHFQRNKSCIYCEMNKWEQKVKERIVFENKYFAVICPFASKVAFQVIVSPKEHLSYFERIGDKKMEYLAEAFRAAMIALNKGLSDPAYNFYLHSAPCDGKDYGYYHWHWTILPKTATLAGFELGTGMEISTIEPEKAAEYLKKQLK